MGCCLGTTANRCQPDNSKLKSEPTPASHSLPPAFEEETVKEVLSETPIIPKTPAPPVIVGRCEVIQSEENKTESESGGLGLGLTKNATDEIQENVSEMSEMYSFSESFSAATTAAVSVADNKKDEIEMDDEGEVTQKVKNRSPRAKRVTRKRQMVSSGELSERKERVVRPPARKQMVPSPEKRSQSPYRTPMNARHRNVGQSNDARREVTARRSRSPAVRGEAGQRRKVRERSPADKRSEVIPVKSEEPEERSTLVKADDGGVSPEQELQTNESLENPLVSLECFIFL